MSRRSGLLAMLMAGFMALSLVGCGGSGSRSDSGSKDKQEPAQEEQQSADKVEEASDGDKGEEQKEAASQAKIAVSIDGATLGEDYEGNPVAIVTYTFTNVSSDEPESYLVSCNDDVYQNGTECELAFATGLEGDSSTKVKAGASTTFQKAYKISDHSDIEVEVGELFSWDKTKLATATLSLG